MFNYPGAGASPPSTLSLQPSWMLHQNKQLNPWVIPFKIRSRTLDRQNSRTLQASFFQASRCFLTTGGMGRLKCRLMRVDSLPQFMSRKVQLDQEEWQLDQGRSAIAIVAVSWVGGYIETEKKPPLMLTNAHFEARPEIRVHNLQSSSPSSLLGTTTTVHPSLLFTSRQCPLHCS